MRKGRNGGESIEVAPGSYLAFSATWPIAALLPEEFRQSCDAHRWQYTTQRSQIVVKVQLFTSPTGGIRKGIEAEVERLAGFFKKNVLVEYEYP